MAHGTGKKGSLSFSFSLSYNHYFNSLSFSHLFQCTLSLTQNNIVYFSISLILILIHTHKHTHTRTDEAEAVFVRAAYPPSSIPPLLKEIEDILRASERQKTVSWGSILCCSSPLIRRTMAIGCVGVWVWVWVSGSVCEN